MAIPVKHSVAVLIVDRDRILTIRRSGNDEELPGVWGLPAGTIRGSEAVEDVVRRIGREKLGVTLAPIRKLRSGVQDRPKYRLEMELWEASMEGIPSYPEWQWAALDLLEPGAAEGSLCCQLAIRSRGRTG